ncbi:predicted protein [Bathycoccus prasinos]|uniref:Uncharacterized protein n=1 Tax=Bathycoccus prasinos TaxID=41875 RepID=K8EYE6_9CHLO|nr:predicted protein [Bathycoccus prasinos]CCO17515.1 predicted protein [Bathycoccus prasinos]|eukprot:XP_007511394.1 predicted protein [Bathycoccus prasinos]
MFASRSFAFSENAFGPRRTGKGGLPPSSMTTTTKQKTFAKKTHLLNERERKRSNRRTLRVVKASDEKSDENNESSSSSMMMNETSMQEMLAKLERAEKEKELLQQKLEETNNNKREESNTSNENLTIDELARMKPRGTGTKSRIDGSMQREQIFDFGKNKKDGNWLQDGLEFVSKEQPSEQLTVAEMSEEDQNTVNRRLAIGIALTVGFIGFGLIPDDSIGGKPEKPLFFYLVPIARSREILRNCEELAEDGDFEALLSNVKSVLGEPNTIKKNLLTACVFLSGREEERAKELAFNIVEDIEKVDFKTYFDTQQKTFDGVTAKKYADFSAKAAHAAVIKINRFLEFFDAESRQAANSQVAPFQSRKRVVVEEKEEAVSVPAEETSDFSSSSSE